MMDFGLTREAFQSTLFEQQAQLFRGALQDRLLVWSDVDRLLHAIEPGAPVMRLFQNGPVPEVEYTIAAGGPGQPRRRLHKVNFYRCMANGATLVINRLEDHCVPALRLCGEVARFSAMQTSANAYLSFTGSGTFGKHWDTHDVFAIQLIGRKRWQIFKPTFPLPLTYQTNERSGHRPPEQPLLDYTLEAGDVIYLPRGWWHRAIPLDEGSFHLSVGCYTSTIYDYILWTASRYLQQHAAARRSFQSPNFSESLTDAIRDLPAVLQDSARTAEFELDMIGRERLVSEFNVGQLLAATRAAEPLPGTAVIRLTTGYRPDLQNDALLVNGTRVQLDPIGLDVVAVLREHASLHLNALREQLRADVSRERIDQVVLDLACREIVTIEV